MPYVRRTWQNAPSSATPLNAAALNNIETGIEEALAKPGATDAAVEAIIADTGSDTYATLNSTIGAVVDAAIADLPPTSQTLLPAANNIVGFCGDSITNASGASTAKGYVHLVRWVAGTRNVDQVYRVYATGGFTSAQVLATHIPTAIAGDAAVLHVAVGTNDAGSDVTVATFSANIIAMHAAIIGAGKRMTIGLVPPRGTGATAAFRRLRAGYNEWISRWAPLNGVPVADTSALANATTGYLRADCDSGDGTHPNDLGHALLAQAVAAAVMQALPPQPHRQIVAPDVNFAAAGAPVVGSGLQSGWSEVSATGTAATYQRIADTTGTLREGAWTEMNWNATTGGARILRCNISGYGTSFVAGSMMEHCLTLEVEDVSGFFAAVAAGTASVRPVLLSTSNTINSGLTPEIRAIPGTHHAFRYYVAATSQPAIGVRVVAPDGVHVKVRVAEVAAYDLTTLGTEKSTTGTGVIP